VSAHEPLLTFYGDDFTGSTDAMEALARAGLRTVLFVEPPGPRDLEALSDLAAVGIAGSTRALPTPELEAALRPALERLRELGAPLTHYKVCSTFDSSPELGSIGRATEVGRDVFGAHYVPLVVGAPRLGRYTAFGHLFARSGLDTPAYRLDRHPTMSRHPATPMDESDLTLHLARQTRLPIGLVDVAQVELPAPGPDEALAERVEGGADVVLVDVLSERHLPVAGRLLWDGAGRGAPFAVGSSGVEYALVEHWRELGLCGPLRPLPPPRPVERVVAVSGSASPVNDRQIGHALAHGFAEVALDPDALDDEAPVAEAVEQLERGSSVILHTARGPDDPRLRCGRRAATTLGDGLGRILLEILAEVPLERAIVAGGDTSAAAVRRLGARALEAVAASAPGSPVCRVHSPGRPVDGLELVLKGGQVGPTSYYVDTRGGASVPAGEESR
jgi:3-oxoisoapionate kinase